MNPRALLAWLPGVAAAQVLAPVTVTATRTEALPMDVPASVSTIGGDALRDGGRAAINVAEALGTVAGVNARDRQNFAQDLQLSIRGFGARSTFGVRGVRVYVDGIPATMPDGQGQLSHVDLASAGRVEVLRGPFSALYGNSSGGVLQVFTKPGEGAPRWSFSAVAGSRGLVRPGLHATGSSGAFGYAISANYLGTQGSREHSEVSRGLANVRLDWHAPEGREWTFVANSLRMKADDPLGLSRAQFESAPRTVDASAIGFDTRKTVTQDQAGVVHEADLPVGKLRAMAYAGRRDTTQFQAIPVAVQANPLHPGGVIGLARDFAGVDLRWTARGEVAGGRGELVAGIAHDLMREHRSGWQNFTGPVLGVEGALRRDEDNHVTSLDPYLQGRWSADTRWTLSAGVRRSNVRFRSADHYVAGANGDDSGSVRYAATLPVVAALYAISPELHAYASAGRGFDTPTFNELAYRPSGTGGLNFALKPSRSNNLEAGLKGRSAQDAPLQREWTAAFFSIRTSDEVVTQANSGGRSTFTNAGRTARSGLELEWRARWAGGWQVQAAQTWLDARYAQDFLTCSATPCTAPNVRIAAGNRIPGTARSTTGLEVAWQPATGWRTGAELRRSAQVWVNDANSESAPSFTTAALHAGHAWHLERWTVSAIARVDNVLDRRYAGSVIVNEGNGRFYEPAPGRSYTVKLVATYTP